MEKLRNIITREFIGWGKYERIVFPAVILMILLISLILKDNPVATISAIFGISYTILAGKGKISCYFFGLAGTFCYSYISFKNGLYGNLALYLCYYLPMQTYGIFKWRNHLKKDTGSIEKIRLSNKSRWLYFVSVGIVTVLFCMILIKLHDSNPIPDSITSIFSILGMLFTVKRCIEQWYVWIIVNGLSTIMWIQAYLNGSNCFATVLMWLGYFVLAFYFLNSWEKETQIVKR